MAIPSLSSMVRMASAFSMVLMKTIASVGLKPCPSGRRASAMLSANADLISYGDFPLIDFAFIKNVLRLFYPF